ncbi:MAG TPA: TIGR02206 family membrane protein [Thermoanaerobaculia bacterium]
MPPLHSFTPFGPSHWAVLVLTPLTLLALVAWVRRSDGEQRERRARAVAWTIAVVLVANLIVDDLYSLSIGTRWPEILPMQLCDWVTLACAAALVWRRQLAYELAYFWGLAGTLQAVFTPELSADFPSFAFVSFMLCHAGAVVAILFLTFGLRFRPVPRSILHAFVGNQVYFVVAMAVNFSLRTNFGFLLHKPQHASLFDYLGPWPIYLLSLEGLGLVLFALLYLPFAVADWRRKRRQTWQAGAA